MSILSRKIIDLCLEFDQTDNDQLLIEKIAELTGLEVIKKLEFKSTPLNDLGFKDAKELGRALKELTNGKVSEIEYFEALYRAPRNLLMATLSHTIDELAEAKKALMLFRLLR